MINSYPSIYNLGHNAVADLLKGPVIVEEKVDGSQFSFMKADDGELYCRSKGAVLNMFSPEKLFTKAVDAVRAVADSLTPGLMFRGEYLSTPKHNVLAYDRVPKNHIIIFDIGSSGECYTSPALKKSFGEYLGFETVPVLYTGMIDDPAQIREFLQMTSILGGQKVEGVVIKPLGYDRFGRDGKVLMAKFVSEEFKETHNATWKLEHGPKSGNDIIQILAARLATPARWQKAVIHLREAGEIENSPRDIGKIIAAVPEDVQKECQELIADQLMSWAWPQLRRSLTRGVPEWYKEQLLQLQFSEAA